MCWRWANVEGWPAPPRESADGSASDAEKLLGLGIPPHQDPAPEARTPPRGTGSGSVLLHHSAPVLEALSADRGGRAQVPDPLLLIDADNLIHRYHHAAQAAALPTLVSALLGLLWQVRPSHLAVVFDSPEGKDRRRALHPGYKASRPARPELGTLFGEVRRVLEAAGIPVVDSGAGEGDDAIATLAERLPWDGSALIASNDKDLAALVRPGVALLVQPGWQRLGEAEVQERFDVHPSQMVDLLALQGDASDEIPGCPGVGPKTALALLREFDSIAGVYKNLWKVKLLPGLRGAGQVAQRLAAGEASVRLSHQLAQLDRAVPGLPDLAALRWIPDRRRARQIQAVCEDLGIPTHTQGLVALQDGWGAAPHKEHAL